MTDLQTLALLLLTLGAYQLGIKLYRHLGQPIFLHPLISACLVIAALLSLSNTAYSDYFAANQWLQFLLGPATVALAIPLQQQLHQVRLLWKPLLLVLPLGALTAAASAILFAHWLGADDDFIRSIATKSITTPIAMATTEKLGGLPVLAAGVVAITGVFGALAGPPLFRLAGMNDHRLQGITLGICAHAMGTARAFEISAQCGAFASLGLGLTGILTALCLPYVFPLLYPLL